MVIVEGSFKGGSSDGPVAQRSVGPSRHGWERRAGEAARPARGRLSGRAREKASLRAKFAGTWLRNRRASFTMPHMSLATIGAPVRIPGWVSDLASFRRWARSPAFPQHGWIAHLDGELWVDLSMERAAHNQAKGAINSPLTLITLEEEAGFYFSDRMLLTNADVGLSTEPDGMFVSNLALADARAVLHEGDETLEVEGSPDMTLEVVSDTSEEKDLVILRDLYWRAGVREYWLVDVRGKTPSFDILRRTATRYLPARKQGGWVKSSVFKRSFRLAQRKTASGLSRFALEIR
jgi:Uma2 family endonuclease